MTLNSTLCEHPAPDAACAADPRIARAEAWLCLLSYLMNLGAWLGRALTRQAAPAFDDPEWTGPRVSFPDRCNPIVIFARIARAVRLAMALRLKIEEQIADLQAGKVECPAEPARAEKAVVEATGLEGGELAQPAEVDANEDLQASKPPVAPCELREQRPESDRFHRLLNGPLKDAVAAICADFGLRPDWSQWTEDGFPPPTGGDVRVWEIFRSPETAPPPPLGADDAPDDAAPIVWRPRWRQPRRSRAKPPLDPRYDRGPATWPDFNDYYYNEVLKERESHEL